MSPLQQTTAVINIKQALTIQKNRYGSSILYNSSLSNQEIKKYAELSDESRQLLLTASRQMKLSTRDYFKIIKIAHTIADLEGKNKIKLAY